MRAVFRSRPSPEVLFERPGSDVRAWLESAGARSLAEGRWEWSLSSWPSGGFEELRGLGVTVLDPLGRPCRPKLPARPVAAPALLFDQTLDGLRGIALADVPKAPPRAVEALGRAGFETVYDLLHLLPRKYLDLSAPSRWADVEIGSQCAVVGTIARVYKAFGNAPHRAQVVDDDGVAISVAWFHAPYRVKKLREGQRVAMLAKADLYRGKPNLANPIVEVVDDDVAGQIIGIYPASGTSELSTWQVRSVALAALDSIGTLIDPVPAHLLAEHDLVSRSQAFSLAHRPATMGDTVRGRDRLAYDELLRLQVVLASARAKRKAEDAFVHRPAKGLLARYLESLPYPLTGAQSRVIDEIVADMGAGVPMERLLQGDVGSGKTVVAVSALLTAVDAGFQAALLAPTEILASQHFAEIRAALTGLGVRVEALTKAVTGKARKQVVAGLADGSVDVVVGAHAILSQAVTFARLSCVVVDEQHRFGVEQRAALAAKASRTPDMLYASATPVPRTAAMTVFGDLDVSVLDEMPPGRTPVKTFYVESAPPDDPDAKPWRAVRKALGQGRQAFVVTPRVAASATREMATAHDTAAALAVGALAGARIGIVTGKDKPEERAATMAEFEAGNLDVLVATTVIEVGVNVPNATVMVILGADKFGVAQLHQLRGRVGRGQHPGTCYLVAATNSESTLARMKALVSTTDGFALAELDLQLRGAGSMSKTNQSGRDKDLRVADILGDRELLAWAKADATAIVAGDPTLGRMPSLRAEVFNVLDETARAHVVSV